MEQSLAIKIIKYLFIALFAVSIIFGVVFSLDALGRGDLLIKWSYVLTFGSIGGVLVFMIKDMFRSKKSIMMAAGIVVFTAILVGISYGMASDAAIMDTAGEMISDGAESKWSGASLYMLYILLGISFVTVLYTELSKAFK